MTRLALLLALCLAGCVPPARPRPPEPPLEPVESLVDRQVVQDAHKAYRMIQANVNREAAAKIRAGEIKTAEQESAFMDPRMLDARKSAMGAIAKLDQDALGECEGPSRIKGATVGIPNAVGVIVSSTARRRSVR